MIATITPLLAVSLFLLATFTVFLYLKFEESNREAQMLQRESSFALQRLHARLYQHQTALRELTALAAEQGHAPQPDSRLYARARDWLRQAPDVQGIYWVSAHDFTASPDAIDGPVTAAPSDERGPAISAMHWSVTHARPEVFAHMRALALSDDAHSTASALASASPMLLQLRIPIPVLPPAPDDAPAQHGWLLMVLAPHTLLQLGTSAEAMPLGYSMALVDGEQLPMGTADAPLARESLMGLLRRDWLPPAEMRLPVAPFGHHLQLHMRIYRTDSGLTDQAFLGFIVIMGLTMLVMLIMNWRLSRRRFQTQRQLQDESRFRRAIENAMTSGIRVLDMQGRTTYANATFSRMVGWSQEELAGMGPPYPYWPQEDHDILLQRFNAEISGKHYPGGLQLRMQRKNGTIFDARIFITPLLNEHRQQTGWLTTINDITEPNRIRQQLAAAQDRITLVLESLDASISVTPLGSRELLFANRLYRQWFGTHSSGHLKLIAKAGVTKARQADAAPGGIPESPPEPSAKSNLEHAEIYIERLDKWVEVRSRYLDWVDGRLAQMVIATDITARKHTEELAARQAEQVQNVSRLITMGEMASSVAHELNQPLAAISNYTNGMIARIENRSISLENLLPPLEKTAHQAVRAGQVILRIREFVKRSAPKREHCHAARIVTEAVEIASIELRRRDTRLDIHLGDNLPPLLADAILIEQVLINLLKNAAEAMSTAQTRQQQRQITLTASAHEHGIEFAIADHGPGIAEDQIAHLFDAFYSTKSDGLGIGLNLCRSIVESHQGKIRVRNLYNDGVLTGCEFSFWLPASSEGAGSAPATPQA